MSNKENRLKNLNHLSYIALMANADDSSDKKELDFLVTIDGKPWFCVEVKLNETSLAPNISYFQERLNIPYTYQVVKQKDIDIVKNECRIISADRFLASLL